MYPLTNQSLDNLIQTLEQIFDTRDKAYMFLRMEFPKILPTIYLECSQHERAWNIYNEFENYQMIGSLMATINGRFDTDLLLEMKYPYQTNK